MAIIPNSSSIKPVETADSMIIVIFGHALLLSVWSVAANIKLYERGLNCKSFGFKKLCRHLITLRYIHEALKYTLPEICTHNHQISVHSYMLQNIRAYICI